MDLYFMNDTDIGKELGHRVKTMRLNKNWTQQEISDFSGISLSAIKSIEGGKGTILSLIKILRALKSLDALNSFLPKPTISPKQLVKLKGKQRTRATGTKKNR
ncbi:MAG: helix-turn-helix domain-containing protein [Desulfobacteraceae bacterium]|nr:helix-turn-helix domain-containing protein [Desulfobacteraceae bacterium]